MPHHTLSADYRVRYRRTLTQAALHAAKAGSVETLTIAARWRSSFRSSRENTTAAFSSLLPAEPLPA
jgi:hypothetical protein